MHHEMLTQRALFCHRANPKMGTLSQHFVTHVVPPLGFVKACQVVKLSVLEVIKFKEKPSCVKMDFVVSRN